MEQKFITLTEKSGVLNLKVYVDANSIVSVGSMGNETDTRIRTSGGHEFIVAENLRTVLNKMGLS